MLVHHTNLPHYDAWLKSTATRFYEIDYAWEETCEHPKRGKFNPDFFVKACDLIIVVLGQGRRGVPAGAFRGKPQEERIRRRTFQADQ